jgi:hypothetical protein
VGVLFIERPIFIVVSPLVTGHPQDMNVTIFEDTINLTCTATGFPLPIITWFHNDTLDTTGSSTTFVANAYTITSTFMKRSPMVNDSGGYSCRAAIEGYDDANSDVVTVLVQGDHQLISANKQLNMNNYHNISDVPERVENIIALEIQSRSLVLSWIEPHDNNAPIEGYFVFYTQPTFAGGETIINSTVDIVITLNELFPGVTYNFTVTAYNVIGNSTPSEVIHVNTTEEGNICSIL